MITIYTRAFCPYCIAAKHFLKKHGKDYEEHILVRWSKEATNLFEISGMTTLPQIFDGKVSQDTCIWGYDDMVAKYKAGEIFK